MHFRLAPRSITLVDIELLWVRIFGVIFRGVSQIWEATTPKRMKIDPYCQRRRVTHWMYVSTLCSLRWFAVDFFAMGLHTRTELTLTLGIGFLVEILTHKSRKWLVFPTLPCLTPPLRGTCQKFCMKRTPQKVEGWVRWKLHNPKSIRFRLIHPCDGQTGGRATAYTAR